MEKDVPLKIEAFHGGDDDRHLITSAKEIEFILRNVAEGGARVALYYDGTSRFILTTLLGVDDGGLWLEQSRNAAENRQVAESGRLTFVSSHLQVKIQFGATHANDVTYRGYPAFYLPLPDGIYRLQRREYYRVRAPANEPPRCTIDTGKPGKKQLREFAIIDMSCGGVGLACTEADTELVPGKRYADCRIDLSETDAIKGVIEVKTLTLLTSPSGHMRKRAGCELKGLDGQSTILLQRYITTMQRTKPRH